MPTNRETGTAGEKLAAEYLAGKGYTIEHLNWRADGCEIDIIARVGDTVVFTEVKTRSGSYFGWPEKAVNKTKKEHIAKAANLFMEEFKIDTEIRFDIISIIRKKDSGNEIYHIEDAFVT